MNINIFGVGRSGTKAVQLYIAYCLSKYYGQVKINYEPYFWLTRKGPVSFRGLYHHLNTPELLQANQHLSFKHNHFLNMLLEKDDSIPTVTKFIRGSGRVSQINLEMNPNATILVVRNLYEVLNSIIRLDWDFYRFGYNYFYLTRKRRLTELIANANKANLLSPTLKKIAANIKAGDRILGNTFYWYLMNKKMLLSELDNTIYVNYEDLSTLPGKLQEIDSEIFSLKDNIKDSYFEGNNIHADKIVKELKGQNSQRRAKKLNAINELSFFIGKGFRNQYPVLVNRKTGTIVKFENKKEVIFFKTKPISKSISIDIEKTSLLGDLNGEIMELLSDKMNEKVISK